MIKVIVAFKRRPGMGVEDFRRYWREEHPLVVERLPGVRRYVQSHPDMSAYRDGREPPFDGVAEVWFDDQQAVRDSNHSPEIQAVLADEANFIDPARRWAVVSEEHIIVG